MALSKQFSTSSALSLRKETRLAIHALLDTSPQFAVTLVWCPAHTGIQEDEVVDEEAKAATTNGAELRLPTSLLALRQQINRQRKLVVSQAPQAEVLRRLRGVYDPLLTRKGLMNLARAEATAIAQLRANHSPLSHFLHCIGVADHPNCEVCLQPETVDHFLMTCSSNLEARKVLFEALRELRIPRKTQTILTNPQAFQPLAAYIKTTGRFERARQWKPPLHHTPSSQPSHTLSHPQTSSSSHR